MSMNVVCLMGRMTADAELRKTNTGKAVTTFTVAVDAYKEATYFINCVAWEKTAEFVSKYFRKGAMIALNGELTTRSYEDKNGNKRTAVEVLARNVSFCGGKNEGAATVETAAPAGDDFSKIDDTEDWPF